MPNRFESRSREISGNRATPEAFFRERRQAIKAVGVLGLGLITGTVFSCGPAQDAAKIGAHPPAPEMYPAPRDTRFNLDRPITNEVYAASYNNFYEFTTLKGRVYRKAARLRTFPWQVAVGGLVSKPGVFDIDELVRALLLKERLYRFRCVEAWRWPSRGQASRFTGL